MTKVSELKEKWAMEKLIEDINKDIALSIQFSKLLGIKEGFEQLNKHQDHDCKNGPDDGCYCSLNN